MLVRDRTIDYSEMRPWAFGKAELIGHRQPAPARAAICRDYRHETTEVPHSRIVFLRLRFQYESRRAFTVSANFGDDARDTLRTIVATIEREISELPATGLRTSWNKLVQTLALGPSPETRRCPACDSIGMRAATRCGHCWAALERLPLVANDETLRRDP